MSHSAGQVGTDPTPGVALPSVERRRRFRAALALSGRTAKDFAADLGISENHLYLVMKGARESRRIDTAVDTLIATVITPALDGVPEADNDDE